MSGNAIIEGHKIAFQDIRDGKAMPISPGTAKSAKIMEFISEWLGGCEYFDVQTSGSTGIPQKIHTHREDMALSARLTASFLGLKTGMKALHCLPIDFIAGKMMAVRAMVCDLDLIVVNDTANPFNELRIQPDFAALSPFQLSRSLKNEKESEILRKTGIVIIGGGPVSVPDLKAVRNWSNSVYHSFGMTESLSHIAMKLLSQGADEDFRLISGQFGISSDNQGRLQIKSPFRHAREIQSSDIVEITGPETFRWLGRADNVINSGGIKVNPEALEGRLTGLINSPFFVSALPDNELGQRIILVIEGRAPAEAEKILLMNKIQGILDSKYLVPKGIYYLESFEYSQGGKISRAESTKLLK